uniref:F-box domain-containing protein n=1 Tax=Romanomermis culicivorax TaxID=13658 RepID=A0A915IJ90_ROMCU
MTYLLNQLIIIYRYSEIVFSRKSKGCAYVTFQTIEDAMKALNAAPVELIFYNKMMSVVPSSKSHCLEMADRQGAKDLEYTALSEGESDLASSTSPSTPVPSDPASEKGINQVLNSLPDQVLSKVFSYLNVFDRVRIERTCKRWQELSFDSWSHTPILHLRYHFGMRRSSKALNNNILRSLLHRCGPHLRHLDLCGAVQFLNDYSLVVIAEFCKQLKSLNLTGLKTQWSALKVFAEACGTPLEIITLRDAYFLSENAFWWLCRSCPHLKIVDFGNCAKIATGKCFRSINTDLEVLKLDGCRRLEASAIQELCLRCTKLKMLNLDDCVKIDDHSLSVLSRSLCRLEYLSLKSSQSCSPQSFSYTPAGLKQLKRLENLVSLHFNRNPVVNDSVLYELFGNKPSKLKRFTIPNMGNGQITKQCLNDVFSSPALSLVELDVSFLPINDEIVENIARHLCSTLQVFRLRGSTQINDKSLEILAENCASLSILDLTDCFSISNSSIRKFFYTQRSIPGNGKAYPHDLEEVLLFALSLKQGVPENGYSLMLLSLNSLVDETTTSEDVFEIL